MIVPIDAWPRSQSNIEFRFPDDACRFKEHLATIAARELGLMPNCDIRLPDPKDKMVETWGQSLLFLETSLRPNLGGPCILFTGFLVEHSMCSRQLVSNR